MRKKTNHRMMTQNNRLLLLAQNMRRGLRPAPPVLVGCLSTVPPVKVEDSVEPTLPSSVEPSSATAPVRAAEDQFPRNPRNLTQKSSQVVDFQGMISQKEKNFLF